MQNPVLDCRNNEKQKNMSEEALTRVMVYTSMSFNDNTENSQVVLTKELEQYLYPANMNTCSVIVCVNCFSKNYQ